MTMRTLRKINLHSLALVRSTHQIQVQVGALSADHCRRENGVAAPPPGIPRGALTFRYCRARAVSIEPFERGAKALCSSSSSSSTLGLQAGKARLLLARARVSGVAELSRHFLECPAFVRAQALDASRRDFVEHTVELLSAG